MKSIDKRFDEIDDRFDKIEERFNKIDEQFTEIRKKSNNQFRWMLGFIIVIFGSPIIQNTITHFWSH